MDILKTLEIDTQQIADFLDLSSYKRAEVSGLSESTWSRWISGERSPTLEKIRVTASSFGMGQLEFILALMVLRGEDPRVTSVFNNSPVGEPKSS